MNGLWTIEFGSNKGVFGSGVVVMLNGKIMGGDATFYYVGFYETSEKQAFKATIEVKPFIAKAESVFKTYEPFTLDMTGTLKDADNAIAVGKPKGMPGLDVGIVLRRRPEAA